MIISKQIDVNKTQTDRNRRQNTLEAAKFKDITILFARRNFNKLNIKINCIQS